MPRQQKSSYTRTRHLDASLINIGKHKGSAVHPWIHPREREREREGGGRGNLGGDYLLASISMCAINEDERECARCSLLAARCSHIHERFEIRMEIRQRLTLLTRLMLSD